jgi:hypothetical protein
MQYSNLAAWTGFILWAFIDPIAAQSCTQLAKDLGKSPDELVDGATYVRIESRWRDLTRLGDLGLSKPMDLPGVHVVKDNTGRERIGVVVVKTGRVGSVPNIRARDVALVRKDFSSCDPGIAVSSVSGEVYDGFHDYGYQDYSRGDLAKLRRFHVAFGRDCKQRTDDDPGGFSRHVSNRASFSFSEDVVDFGGYTSAETIASYIGVGRVAQAQRVRSTQPAVGQIDREAEIKSYATTVGMACIPVVIPYVGSESFFRTNDLAGPFVQERRERRY